MDQQHDELTETGVIRFQTASRLATARFISHFVTEPRLPEPSALNRIQPAVLS